MGACTIRWRTLGGEKSLKQEGKHDESKITEQQRLHTIYQEQLPNGWKKEIMGVTRHSWKKEY